MRSSPWPLAGLFALLSACADDASRTPSDEGGAPASPVLDGGCTTFVADSLIDHACFHERMGPYVERTASGPSRDLDRAHTSFRVQLPARASGGYGGVLTYNARSAGDYAIFSREARTLHVSADGAPVASSFAHPTEICPPLPEVAVYPLAARGYTVEVESDRPEVVLVLEAMDDDAYRTTCEAGPRPRRDAAVFALDASTLDASTLDAGACTLDPVLEHACLHVQHGPFAEVGNGGDVSKVHTAWRLSSGTSVLGYRPASAGEYVFYLDQPLSLALRDGNELLQATYSEPVTTCEGVREARVFRLAQRTRYDVELGPGDAALLVIEHVDAFASDGWSQRFEACP